MKVAVLTLRLHTNYGGILQAYALCRTLDHLGYEAVLLDYQPNVYDSFRGKCHVFLKNMLRTLKGEPKKKYPTNKELHAGMENILPFIDRYFDCSKPLTTTEELRNYLSEYEFEACIVGSDQVWRPFYAPQIENFFLDFCPDELIKVAYAASFGTDEWEFSSRQTKKCRTLLKKFTAVSVREFSAVAMCDKYLDVKAVRMPDPTTLLDIKEYALLCEKVEAESGVFAYIMDDSERGGMIAEKIGMSLGKKVHCLRKIDGRAAPVEEWLKNIMSADFVVTDSFHACVFAILFNKPFVCLGNKERGQSRFVSLLGEFGLQDRLLSAGDEFRAELLTAGIDWDTINDRLDNECGRALDFLDASLQ